MNIKPVMKAKEVADYLGLSVRTVYKMIKNNDINHIKVGGGYRITGEQLESYLAGQTKGEDND